MHVVNRQDLPLSSVAIDQIEAVVLKKQSNEVRAIIFGDFRLEFDVVKASFISAGDDQKSAIKNKIKTLAQTLIMEAIASNALKKFCCLWGRHFQKALSSP